MRIAVVGGTGLVGREVVDVLTGLGHEAIVIARSHGVDLTTGAGLDHALQHVEALVDVSNSTASDPAVSRSFFETAAGLLLDAEQRAGVRHHVVLSIVGVDRVQSNGHYAGKRLQEQLASTGPIPVSILRATQFHDFASMVVGWTRDHDVAIVPPLLVQPVAVTDVAEVLVEIVTSAPQERLTEIAGPDRHDLVDMARRTLAARGDAVRLVPSWRGGVFSPEMAGEVLLPGPGARIAPTSFETWLAAQDADAD